MPGVLLTEESAMIPRALVIQSRPDVARAVSASLADVEVHAIVLSDGHAAVSAVETWDTHVVLVDLTLPPLDGWCVLAAVGARADRPLLVVRVADASQVERAVALGADAWVDNDVHIVAAAGRLALTLAA
jgi:DNA-binding response OmpR family regulator